ncbi:helix-turn-helix domain-containing protein [Rahnella woolbedingensis]|uniref:Crp/Fnr family transcriptional regulator n=1 Tax=Rahnella woolbedingensis TaxID=1510574 RepID=A0A419NA00_9GAMM|nr:helix-turn-helix domain-containing protein [Rahnella woolbedingensis]RJT44745.1 Crp/Fnr family transcriptional regulator [Rahnella woolbedingensis]
MKTNNNLSSNGKKSPPGQKPLEAITRLVEVCLPHATAVVADEKNIPITMNAEDGKQQIILLVEGDIKGYRSSDNLLYGIASAPAMLGLMTSEYSSTSFIFKANKDSKVWVLPRDVAIDLIAEHGLVRELIAYTTSFTDYRSYHSDLMINRTAYDIICGLLLEMERLPEEFRRKNSMANFILERSNLARSGVMKILADLRVGGYIDIQNGKLIAINKRLPDEY